MEQGLAYLKNTQKHNCINCYERKVKTTKTRK